MTEMLVTASETPSSNPSTEVKPIAKLEKLRECIINVSNPISKRTHAAFILRTIGSIDAALIIAEALQNRKDSSLMRHELAYILGQMQHRETCPILSNILQQEDEDDLVRHECAEAIGAIGDEAYISVLEKYCNHEIVEISETCQIAVALLQWRKSTEGSNIDEKQPQQARKYLSIDPAPPLFEGSDSTSQDQSDVSILGKKLVDPQLSLFERYRVMFSLRNWNNDEAALVLVQGLKDSSALFRHEIAYVLGQMQREISIEGLENVLANKVEHRMVRHEAAEAIGAIGGEKAYEILEKFQNDGERVVEESCFVALDTMEYWETSDFKDGL